MAERPYLIVPNVDSCEYHFALVLERCDGVLQQYQS